MAQVLLWDRCLSCNPTKCQHAKKNNTSTLV